MIEPIRILTQRRKGEAHHETLLTIDWDKITDEELKLLARNALIHDFQARLVKSEGPMPEKATIIAREQVYQPPVALMKYQPPPPKPVKVSNELEKLLLNLSAEELQILLGSD